MRRGTESTNRPIDFFISYSPADERWATWIAWELESAGYSTMLQAWDFVPGTNFIDFMDRGVSEAAVVISVLSRNYLASRYGRLEWQAALRAEPDGANRLVTIRVEDCPLEGLLSMITYLDLVGVRDPKTARTQLLSRIEQALGGRAKPDTGPGYPAADDGSAPPRPLPDESGGSSPSAAGIRRRVPVSAPAYPPVAPGGETTRSAVTVLHVSGPRFGRGLLDAGAPSTADELQAQIFGELTRLTGDGAPAPDLLVVSGDLTETGSRREFAIATEFLTGLRVLLGLEPNRLVVVPGAHDITRPACQAYFANCEADDVAPKPPYWPKWRHYTRLFEELYQGLDQAAFDGQHPWTLFTVPDLQVVVAGLNSTINDSHREEDHYGWLGEAQAAWFAQRLRSYEQRRWLRIGVQNHPPATGAGPDPGGRRDPALLRDTDTLRDLLGKRLNLLLHGAGRGREDTGINTLDAGLPLVGPDGPGRCQLLQITAEGLLRIPCRSTSRTPAGGTGEREELARHWAGADATFMPAREPGEPPDPVPGRIGPGEPGPGEPGTGDEPGTGEPGPGGEQATAPIRLLLERITEVLHTRYDNPKIRLIAGAVAHLLVSHREDGFVRQHRVAAWVGELTTGDVERIFDQVHAADPDTPSELVYQGPPVGQALRVDAARRGIRLRSFIEFQGLLDLREFVAEQTTRLRTDALYPPEGYVPQRFRELTGSDRTVRRDLAGELLTLLAADDGRFVLLMGDFGRGKTFALREVARRIPAELAHLIPILLELRTLEKAHSVEAMVAAHLANQGEELIDLKAFNYMLREGRIVLLFDGFDELATRVTYDRAAEHLELVLCALEGKAKIIVSSRSQHFQTDAQVLTALGERVGVLAQRRVLSIEDFTPDQIRLYLGNRYGGDTGAADDRLRLLSGAEGLLGLAQNPRMLSFIADLDENRLRAVAESGQVISAAFLYEEILHNWLSHEEQRTSAVHGAAAGLTVADLWQAVTALAVRLWESSEQYLELTDVAEVAETLSALCEHQLTAHQAVHAVGAGSLLVRTEHGMLGMIHGSVVEWLVARAIADQLAVPGEAPLLSRRPLSQLSVDFLCDLADARHCQLWVRRVLADHAETGTAVTARLNAIKISNRLRSMARTDLRGAVLRGEDLSHRELLDADLTGADLTDARLVGANLSRAVLRNAVLAGARLDEATLVGADLTGADFTRARLPRADLRDVVLTGSRWRGAALIDVTARQEFFAAPELHGAAIAPGRPVEAEFAPAAIGVSYGFEVGRLPYPVAYSNDGTMLALGSDDGGVLICDAVSGLALRTLHGHRGRVYAVAYHPTGTVLATAAGDCEIRLWDPATGAPLHSMTAGPGWVWPMVVSPETADLLAAGDNAGTVRLWDVTTGTVRQELAGHAPPVWTAGFRPDGGLLAVGDSAGTVRLWDVTTGALRAEFPDHRGPVYRLVFSPDGTQLATTDHGGTIRVYDVGGDLRGGDLRAARLVHELCGHTAAVYALDFHPGGGLLASGDTHGGVRLWELPGGRGEVLAGQPSGAIYWVSFSPDGELLGIGGNTGVITLWDTADRRLRHELVAHRASTWPIAFRPDGRQLATSSNDGTARLWDPATGQCRHVLRGHGRRITSVQFNSAGSLLATCGNDGVVRLWDPRTGTLRRPLTGIADRLISAIFDPAGDLIATPSNDGDMHLWNAGTGGYERALDVDTDYVWASAFSPDGDILATANDDDTVQLWYRTTGRNIGILAEHRGRVRSISFSPDGTHLATGCDDSMVRLWQVDTGVCHRTLRSHTDRVYAVLFTADGSRLVSAGHDGTACVWDVRTGEVLTTLTGHTGRIWSAALDPAGTMLATGGDDLVVRLWDAGSGAHLHSLQAHTRRVWSVAFSPDGRRLASGGDDGTARIWDLAHPGGPRLTVTLLGLPEGWAGLAPDGRYKLHGTVAGEFWHVIGTCRFEPGDMDSYLPEVRQLPLNAEF